MTATTTNPQNTFALLIGIGKRPQGDSDAMAITADDAERMAKELHTRVGIPEAQIFCLTKEKATKAGILQALDTLKSQTQKTEMVWVYFSGHGYASKNQGHYLICHDTTEADWQQSALAGNDLVERLQAISAEKMLVLLDCCHAGGITTDALERADVPFDAEKLLKAQANRVVLTASHAAQTSLVSRPVSLFTFALIEGLAGTYLQANEKDIRFFDLAMYVRERVSPLSKKKQQPQLNVLKESSTQNFVLLSYPNGKPTERAFEESFELLDESKNLIDLQEPTETDHEYRKNFPWLMNNNEINATITGDGNMLNISNNVNQNITIQFNLQSFPAMEEMGKLLSDKNAGISPEKIQEAVRNLSEQHKEDNRLASLQSYMTNALTVKGIKDLFSKGGNSDMEKAIEQG
ncbi:MAG: caspase family protein [Cytophagales bacterium]|nr:MAG: caspase family protein [Cytophagales bacterium]